MALPSERDELIAAWRALGEMPRTQGWLTIRIAADSPCPLLAGRRFPENEEALLVGFSSSRVPPADCLPQGRGFFVSKAELGEPRGGGRVWIALSRQAAGRLDLFAMMAEDVVSTLARLGAEDDERFYAFLARIRAWQDFMRNEWDGVLAPEAEIGLFGELEFLGALLSAGIPASVALEAWRGPLNGIQDFKFGAGAIEVKSTVSPSGFLATAGSLEQLDDSMTRPLFLAAVRFALDASGRTLPEQVDGVRDALREDPAALAAFGSLLLHAGFLAAAHERYIRRFSRPSLKILPVSESFPRLTRGNVAMEIRTARYDIDLDLVQVAEVGLRHSLHELGVVS